MLVPDSTEEEKVMNLQHLFWTALKAKNPGLFEDVLSEDFVSRSPEQPNQTRDEFIESLTSFPAQVVSVGSDNVEIHVFGDVAVLTGLQVANLEFIGGTQIVNQVAITNIFRRVSDQWRMVLSHPVELPSPIP